MTRTCNCRMALSALAAVWTATATAQPLPPNVMRDHAWVADTSTAALVFAPPKLAAVTRWTIESRRHRGLIHASCPSPDGSRIATGGVDGVVRIWNLETGSLDGAILADRFELRSLAWSPDGSKLATVGSADPRVKIWDAQTRKLLAEPQPPKTISGDLTWSHDSRRLAARSASGSGAIYVSDALGDFKLVKEAGKPVVAIAWSRDSGLLAFAVSGDAVNVVETSGWAFRYALEQKPDEVTRDLAWSPDGKFLATVGNSCAATWKSDDGAAVSRTPGAFTAVAWAPDSSRVLAASSVGVFVNPADGKVGTRFPAGGMIHWSAATGRITSVTADTIQVWEPDGTKSILAIDAGGSHAPVFQAGRPVVTGIGTKVLSLWHHATFKRIATLEGHTAAVTVATWSRDGKHFASGDADGMVRLWDVDKGAPLQALTAHKGAVKALAWSPDGGSLASGGIDNTVRLWSADGEERGLLTGHANMITSLVWAPKSAQFASGSYDKKIIVWNSDTREQVRTIECPTAVMGLDWTIVKGVPAIACGLYDGGAKAFNAATGAEIATMIEASTGFPYGMQAVAWTPGPQPGLLTARWRATQVWDILKKDTVARQIAPGGADTVFPTAGGRVAVVRARDRTARFWSPADNGLVGVLLDDDGKLAAISTGGDVKFDPDAAPDLIAIIETPDGHQKILSLDELKTEHGWKNAGKAITLPTKN